MWPLDRVRKAQVDSAQVQKWEPETYDRVFRDIATGLALGSGRSRPGAENLRQNFIERVSSARRN